MSVCHIPNCNGKLQIVGLSWDGNNDESGSAASHLVTVHSSVVNRIKASWNNSSDRPSPCVRACVIYDEPQPDFAASLRVLV